MEFIEAKVGQAEPSPTSGGPQEVGRNPPHPGNQGGELVGDKLELKFKAPNPFVEQHNDGKMATHDEGRAATGDTREIAGRAKGHEGIDSGPVGKEVTPPGGAY